MPIGGDGPLDELEFGEGLSESVPPFLSNQVPAPAATGVNPTDDITFTIDDLDSGVLLSSVIVSVDDGGGFDVAYTGGAFQAGFTGSATPNGIGYDFVVNPNAALPASQLIQVRVQGTDVDGNAIDETYSYTTSVDVITRLVDGFSHGGIGSPPIAETNPPYLLNHDPAPGQVNVVLNPLIQFRVTDDPDDANSGVDINTLVVEVKVGAAPSVIAYSAFAGGFQPGFTGSVTDVFMDEFSYDIEVDPAGIYPGLTVIEVRVTVRDKQPLVVNLLDTSYTFTTKAAEATAPFLSNESPAPGSGPLGNLKSTDIAFRVSDAATDPDSGVNIDTLRVEIRRGVGEPFEDAILGGAFQPGFTGTITPVGGTNVGGIYYFQYDILINPSADLNDADTASVRVNVDDTKSPTNHLNTTYSFDLEQSDASPPVVTNQDPAPGESGVPGDTSITFDIVDVDSGVDAASIAVSVSIDGGPASQAVLGGVIQAGWSGSISIVPNGYRYVLTPATPFGTSHLITVSIDGQDLADVPNVM